MDDSDLQRRLEAVEARIAARGISLSSLGEDRPAPPISAAARERLAAFSPNQVATVEQRLGPPLASAWPDVGGCLGVLFTSRTGSSYLARELAARYDIGRMEECLNPHVAQGIAAGKIVASFAGAWFSFKLGVPGIIGAELTGTIDRYLPRTSFIFLLRRDIIAQAVSLVKANQTGQWHSISAANGAAPIFDGPKIAQTIRVISAAVISLAQYLEIAGRPWRKLIYEDFESGDFSSAEAICETFAAPRIDPERAPRFAPLEKTADAVNEAWIDRFLQNVEPRVQDAIDRYRALV